MATNEELKEYFESLLEHYKNKYTSDYRRSLKLSYLRYLHEHVRSVKIDENKIKGKRKIILNGLSRNF